MVLTLATPRKGRRKGRKKQRSKEASKLVEALGISDSHSSSNQSDGGGQTGSSFGKVSNVPREGRGQDGTVKDSSLTSNPAQRLLGSWLV